MLFKGMTEKEVKVVKLPLNMHIRKLHICRCVYAVTVPVNVNEASKLGEGFTAVKVVK